MKNIYLIFFLLISTNISIAEENRAINLFKEVRCLVCQGQTIHESNAEMAEDLKEVIREKIDQGQTDGEIKSFLIEKYGNWIIMTPPFNRLTYLLWFVPLIILLFGIYFILSKKSHKKTLENKNKRPLSVPPLFLEFSEQFFGVFFRSFF